MAESAIEMQTTADSARPRLRRVLSLSDLVLYGIVLIMPIAPVPLFGVVQKLSLGHAVTAILIAMVAMVLTAFSYGRMAALYPSAGSAYTYVGRGLNLHLGFLAGWAMILDYLLVPLICTIYGALTLRRLVPEVPYAAWAALFAGAITLVNLRGIRTTAKANLLFCVVMFVVVLWFVVLAIRFLFLHQGWPGLLAVQPFYDAKTFRLSSIGLATSVAALTYGGFDGVTTLEEEVKNPRRNVLLATVLVCLFTGIFGGLQIYLAQRVWPNYLTFPNLETAFMDVSRVVGGALLFEAMAAILIVANFGSGLTAQGSISRLLFCMGRDGMLPRRAFAYLNAKRNAPVFNICLVGLLAFLGALVLNYERSAELINFGAFLAFMGVNAAVVRQFYIVGAGTRKKKVFTDIVLPAAGFIFCLAIWLNLATPAKIAGTIWFAVGFSYNVVLTRGFRLKPAQVDFSEC